MYEPIYYRIVEKMYTSIIVKKMYEHVYYRKKDVRARLLSQKRCTSTSIIVKKMYERFYYRRKDVRARLLS